MINTVYDWKRSWLPRGKHNKLEDSEYSSFAEFDSNTFSFEAINRTPCLVLLGEPGIGKSYTLLAEQKNLRKKLDGDKHEMLALDLSSIGSEDRLVRKLFENPIFIDWIGSDHRLYLFLDSLDECLLRIDVLASLLIDEIQPYIDQIDRLFLRMACRTADWPLTLEAGLLDLWGEKSVGFYELAPLRHTDIIEAAELNSIHSDEFLTEIRKKEVNPLAIKPVTLNFLLNIYLRDGRLPPTKTEIYRKGCLLLCEEPNPRRRSLNQTGNFTAKFRMTVASHIAAFTILANRYAVWIDIDEGNVPEESLKIQELVGDYLFINSEGYSIDETDIKRTLTSGLFSSRGSQLLGWSHQTYAEFLAALYIVENMTTDQINNLLFTSDGKLVPQLYQTASWIAGLNRELFWQIMKSEPQVLLNSDMTTDDIEGKSALVEALLQLYEDRIISSYSFTNHYSKLHHPNLVQQVSSFISDHPKSENGRVAAIRIAEECGVPGLDEELLQVALDSTESLPVRISATSYICNTGEESTKAKLKPLVMVPDQDSIADDLKYSALKAIWPDYITAEEVFSIIVPPTDKENIITLRSPVLRQLTDHLKESDVLVALEWVCNMPRRHNLSSDYVELMDSVMLLAWKHFQNTIVREAFATAALSRVLKYDVIIGEGHIGWSRDKSHPEFASELQNNTDIRRQLFLEILAVRNESKPLLFSIYYAPPLIDDSDLEWLILCFQNESSEQTRLILAEIIKRLFRWNVQSHFETVFNACYRDAALDKALENPFASIELESEKAQELKTAFLKRKALEDDIQPEPPLDPPSAGQIALMMDKCETGNLLFWIHLTSALSLTSDQSGYLFDWHPDLTERSGWQNADEQTRERIINLAKRYVVEEAPEDNDWFGTNSFPYAVLAGYQALLLILQCDPQSLIEIPSPIWGQWTPIILRYPNESGENQQTLASIAYQAIPDLFIEKLTFLIEIEDSQGHVISLQKIEKCWDEKLVAALSHKLNDNQQSEAGLNSLLITLLEHNSKEAKDFVESLIIDPDLSVESTRKKAIFGVTALLTRVEEFKWSMIWSVIQSDRKFGRSVFESVATHARKSGNFPSQLNENELADLYIWLGREYPHAEDPDVKGWHQVTAREEVGRFRDSILHQHLVGRGTQGAHAQIRRIMEGFPHLELEHLLASVQEKRLRKNWTPIKPQELHRLLQDPQIMLVQSGDELLGVLLDSLIRLQQKLIGETPAVRDVWDKVGEGKYRPISENDLSDYVKRHFDEDIVQRGIVANREVQIRRGKERTDIHINAIIRDERRQVYDIITAIIEVKGCWHREVMDAMTNQLLDRYLKNNHCQHGLYLVGWFLCNEWDDDDYRKTQLPSLSLDDLREALNNQAAKLSLGEDKIDAYILDCSFV